MNCNICGKEKAVLHIVETIDEKRDKISVCKKCSKDFGIIEKCFESLEDNNNLISIFPNHKSTKLKKIKANKKNRKETCNACGYSLNDFLKTLDQKKFEVLKYEFFNQINNPPYLFAIEKIVKE